MRNSGFTLIEMMVVMMVGVILISFTSVSLLGVRSRTALTTMVNTLVTDLRSQQLKAMNGEAPLGAGVYFYPQSYVLFSGPVYDADSESNFTIYLDEVDVTAISYANQTIFFAPRSGNVSGVGELTIKGRNTGEEKVLKFNSLGTIYE